MSDYEKIYEITQTMTDDELCDFYNKHAYMKVLVPVREDYTRLFEEHTINVVVTFLREAEPFNIWDEFFLIDLEHKMTKSISQDDINCFVAEDKNVQSNYFRKED
jgi:hypothetical protein